MEGRRRIREGFLEGVALGLSVEEQDEARGHGEEGSPSRGHCRSRVGAGPRASVSSLHMGKAVGNEMGEVGWRQVTGKEL